MINNKKKNECGVHAGSHFCQKTIKPNFCFFSSSFHRRNIECPSLEHSDKLSQTLLVERLTHECRYDRLERPGFSTRTPVKVNMRAYIYFMQNLEAHDLVNFFYIFHKKSIQVRIIFKAIQGTHFTTIALR